MSTPDWPERLKSVSTVCTYKNLERTDWDEVVTDWYTGDYVLELERRYALLHQAVLERSQAPARGINCIKLLAQCPPLPKEKERE